MICRHRWCQQINNLNHTARRFDVNSPLDYIIVWIQISGRKLQFAFPIPIGLPSLTIKHIQVLRVHWGLCLVNQWSFIWAFWADYSATWPQVQEKESRTGSGLFPRREEVIMWIRIPQSIMGEKNISIDGDGCNRNIIIFVLAEKNMPGFSPVHTCQVN